MMLPCPWYLPGVLGEGEEGLDEYLLRAFLSEDFLARVVLPDNEDTVH